MNIQEEINQNMTVSAGGGFTLNNDELESLKNNQVWNNSRANRRKAVVDITAQRNNAQQWINSANMMEPQNSNIVVVQQLAVDENQDDRNVNNKNSSEDITTLRENRRNSKESVKKSSSENILEIEENMRKSSLNSATNNKLVDASVPNNVQTNVQTCVKTTSRTSETSAQNSADTNLQTSVQSSVQTRETSTQKTDDTNFQTSVQSSVETRETNTQKTDDTNFQTSVQSSVETRETNTQKTVESNVPNVSPRNNPSTLRLNNKISADTPDGLNESSMELYQSPTSPTAKDPHSAYIDLSNNCRQFYFSHMKTAEAIKKTVRNSRHNKAMDKVQGKPSSGIDNAMDRLRTEMADLMEQDLSLMSQLLTLNDKIEEIKNHVRNSADSLSQSMNYFSTGDVTDNEYSDLDESGIFNRDFSVRRDSVALNSSFSGFTKKYQPPVILEPDVDHADIKPRKIEPSEREIIVYRKKKSKRKTNTGKVRSRSNSSAEDSEATDEESDTTEDSDPDTDSTLSCNSSSCSASDLTETDTKETSDPPPDSGIQSPTTETKKPEDVKPVKGGVSRNRFFLKFHKKNGVSDTTSGTKSVLTLQGHHIPLEKYYIPQGLVYLKHTKSDNVFCQFSH